MPYMDLFFLYCLFCTKEHFNYSPTVGPVIFERGLRCLAGIPDVIYAVVQR